MRFHLILFVFNIFFGPLILVVPNQNAEAGKLLCWRLNNLIDLQKSGLLFGQMVRATNQSKHTFFFSCLPAHPVRNDIKGGSFLLGQMVRAINESEQTLFFSCLPAQPIRSYIKTTQFICSWLTCVFPRLASVSCWFCMEADWLITLLAFFMTGLIQSLLFWFGFQLPLHCQILMNPLWSRNK